MTKTCTVVAMAIALAVSAMTPALADGPDRDGRSGRSGQVAHRGPETAASTAQRQMGTATTCEPITEDTVLNEGDCWSGTVAGDGVTVDLNGRTVRGILIEGDGVVVRNGTVDPRGGDLAIFVLGDDALLERLTVQNGSGFVVEAGHRTTIRHSTLRDNAGVAVSQYHGSHLTVEHSTFVDNRTAVSIQSGSDALIQRNRFERNRTGVNIWDEDLFGASDTTIRRNRFLDNGFGIRITGLADANGTLIERNTIRGSEASGILVTSQGGPTEWGPGGAADTEIRNNLVQRSGDQPAAITICDLWEDDTCETTTADDGITVLATDPVVLPTIVVAHNKAMHNAGYGIEADGVADGGNNVAVRNGAGSCIGVTCRGR